MRNQWTEKAIRLAEKHELYDSKDQQTSTIESILTTCNGVQGIGIIDEQGRRLWWTLKKHLIDVEVRLR